MKYVLLIIFVTIICSHSFAQSNFDKILKGSEIVMTGLSIFKIAKSDPKKETADIESLCVKNKLAEKITFRINGKDKDDNDLSKELVIQKDGKECAFNIPKGIYTYEVVLANKEIYKKGEYKFDDDIVITIKKEE